MAATTTTPPETRYQVADLLVDMAQRRVLRDGSAIEVSALNFDLLRVLIDLRRTSSPTTTSPRRSGGGTS